MNCMILMMVGLGVVAGWVAGIVFIAIVCSYEHGLKWFPDPPRTRHGYQAKHPGPSDRKRPPPSGGSNVGGHIDA